jgi:HEAT repeat protein
MLTKYRLISMSLEALLPLTFGTLLLGMASAQVNPNQPSATRNALVKERLPGALNRIKQGEFFPADPAIIAEAGAVQALPDLKRQFDVTKDENSKDSIASALVRLGDKDRGPWDYLVQGAADAITSDIPSRQRFDSNGRLLPGPSPDFIAWAKAHNLTSEAADDIVMRNLSKILHLGEAGDKRAIPLLRQALFSKDYMTQTAAAKGLAELQDRASIPLIMEACRQAPADAAMAISRSLLDFNDPNAQAAAKEFRPEKDQH